MAHGVAPAAAAPPAFDVARVRSDFPILSTTVRGKPLVYLDNAATGQKPRAVIDAVTRFYREENASVHRGVYHLSEQATDRYEATRGRVARYIGAADPREVVFVRGTTEAINLVASSWGRANLKRGDEVLVTAMEHHSNLVPWQMVCEATGAQLRVIPMDRDGALLLEEAEQLCTDRTRLVAVVHVSNSLGTVNPVQELVALARAKGALVLVDGAQALPHGPVDVASLGCDFYAGSGHKMFGPTGIGFLWGRRQLLDSMPPYQGGGSMIRKVTFPRTTFADAPARFEAGTPHIEGVIGLGAAVDYLQSLPWDSVRQHEARLLEYATECLREVAGVTVYGTAPQKASVLSFTLDGVHAHDVGTIADQDGICVRAGHHCTQPVMDFFGIAATVRASFAFYNTREEADALARAVAQARRIFG
ncbi:MAG TPA: cysteine desulfurase [Gemmatimonadales bacterium]|nr:cysteine desulfurase [Gemmatimonadales bacterium]